jgi:hypothetical protein
MSRRAPHGICPRCGSAALEPHEKGIRCKRCDYFGAKRKFTNYPMNSGQGEQVFITSRNVIPNEEGDWNPDLNHRKGRHDKEL